MRQASAAVIGRAELSTAISADWNRSALPPTGERPRTSSRAARASGSSGRPTIAGAGVTSATIAMTNSPASMTKNTPTATRGHLMWRSRSAIGATGTAGSGGEAGWVIRS